jgi:hypothetical protein
MFNAVSYLHGRRPRKSTASPTVGRSRKEKVHMTSDHHSPPTESAMPQWPEGEDIAEPTTGTATSEGVVQYREATAFQQPPAKVYVHKNPVLYALGGVFFPPLVLFLMGGSRKTCIIMLCIWPISFLLLFLLFIGAIPLVGMYFWSIMACYREAVRQNEAHGLV